MSSDPMWTTTKVLLFAPVLGLAAIPSIHEDRIAMRVVDPNKESITFHWKNDSDNVMGNIAALDRALQRQGKALRFAMNGGMYTRSQGPVGLYVEEGRMIHPIDRRTEGKDNFHMQPNGVFGLYADGSAFVRTTGDMAHMRDVQYATQSGPMLVINGVANKHFTPGSKNLNIRNAVGVLPDGRVVFAISKEPVNFHDFAGWFIEKGCDQALYLDGFVSKAFIPEEGLDQRDGSLGVLIAVTEKLP